MNRVVVMQLPVDRVSRPEVIVADDDAIIRDVMRASLARLDCDAYLACNGAEALDLASVVAASLVIVDLKMPRKNGLDVCQEIRTLKDHATTPVVVLSALADERTRAAAFRAGATAFYAKPFRHAEMVATLSRYLPIAPSIRQAINRDARRAMEIANLAPAPSALSYFFVPLRDKPHLDHGRRLLDNLRFTRAP